MCETAGAKANFKGKELENAVEHEIYSYLNVRSEMYSNTDERDNILLKNVPYESIYKSKCRSEFLLCYEGREIRIECKAQNSHGSVDEKLPYLFNNMTADNNEESVVILSGDGFRKGAKGWMRDSSVGTKLLVFCSLQEFTEYLKEGLPRKKYKQSFIDKIKKCFHLTN